MRSLTRKPSIPYGILAAAFSLVVITFGIILATHTHAESQTPVATGEHLITLHENGQDKGFLTDAKTLGEAFKKAGVQIDPNDLVEPGLDETLVASHYDVNVYRARPVTVIDGNTRTKILSPYQTPKQIVEHANFTLQDEDITTVSANNDMVSQGAGLQVAIDRATTFTFVLYGKTIAAYTQATTVGEMLEQKKITLGKNDTVSVPNSTPIVAGMTVELWRNGVQTVTEDQDIKFDIEQIQSADHEAGYKEVKTPGVVGKRTVSYEIEMKNGQEISRKEIQSVVTKESVKQVEVVGTKNKFSGSLNEWLSALRGCETGGIYTRNSGNGYYGAYQFLPATWNSVASKTGRPDLVGVRPDMANPADQDAMVIANTNLSKGGLATQHPGCYKKLGLAQFPPN